MRLRDETTLPSTYEHIYIENDTQAKFFEAISSGSPSIKLLLKLKI